jgi:hypothetical protein
VSGSGGVSGSASGLVSASGRWSGAGGGAGSGTLYGVGGDGDAEKGPPGSFIGELGCGGWLTWFTWCGAQCGL